MTVSVPSGRELAGEPRDRLAVSRCWTQHLKGSSPPRATAEARAHGGHRQAPRELPRKQPLLTPEASPAVCRQHPGPAWGGAFLLCLEGRLREGDSLTLGRGRCLH